MVAAQCTRFASVRAKYDPFVSHTGKLNVSKPLCRWSAGVIDLKGPSVSTYNRIRDREFHARFIEPYCTTMCVRTYCDGVSSFLTVEIITSLGTRRV